MLGFLNRLLSSPQSQYFQIDRRADAGMTSLKIENLKHFYKASRHEITLALKKDEDKRLVEEVSLMFEKALRSNEIKLAARSYAYAYTLDLHEVLGGFNSSLDAVTDLNNRKNLGNAIFSAYKEHYWKMRQDISTKLALMCHDLGQDREKRHS